MAQQIDLVARFLALIDAVYKVESLTARLDTLTRDVPFSGANEVKVMKLSTVGLGTYSRAAGYPAGDITATWETMQLTAERGRAYSLDRMDNEETLGLVREVHDASRPSFNLARPADAVEWVEGYYRLDPRRRGKQQNHLGQGGFAGLARGPYDGTAWGIRTPDLRLERAVS